MTLALLTHAAGRWRWPGFISLELLTWRGAARQTRRPRGLSLLWARGASFTWHAVHRDRRGGPACVMAMSRMPCAAPWTQATACERFGSLKPVPDTTKPTGEEAREAIHKKGHRDGARGRGMRAAWLRRALGLLALALAADAVLTKPSKLTTCA